MTTIHEALRQAREALTSCRTMIGHPDNVALIDGWITRIDAALSEKAEVVACRELTDADMDQIAAWIGQQERGDIGFHALCDNIIRAYAAHPTRQPEAQAGFISEIQEAQSSAMTDEFKEGTQPLYISAAQQPEAQGVPAGWNIAKSVDGEILVSAPDADPGGAWIKNQGPLAQRLLYVLADAMLQAAAQQPAPQPVADPCPGCIKGGVCKKPTCGRLKLPENHPARTGAAPQPADERGAFEAWISAHVESYSGGRHTAHLERSSPDGYSNTMVHQAWRGWQARAALSTAPLAREWRDAVLAYLDDLKDDAAAHIWPDDLEKCGTTECVVQVASVRMGSPDGNTVPLFSRDQVDEAISAALKANNHGGGV